MKTLTLALLALAQPSAEMKWIEQRYIECMDDTHDAAHCQEQEQYWLDKLNRGEHFFAGAK